MFCFLFLESVVVVVVVVYALKQCQICIYSFSIAFVVCARARSIILFWYIKTWNAIDLKIWFFVFQKILLYPHHVLKTQRILSRFWRSFFLFFFFIWPLFCRAKRCRKLSFVILVFFSFLFILWFSGIYSFNWCAFMIFCRWYMKIRFPFYQQSCC